MGKHINRRGTYLVVSFRDVIRARERQLFTCRPATGSDGRQHAPSQLEKDMLVFDYARIDPRYWAGTHPKERITLYKGGLRQPIKGFASLAIQNGMSDHITEVKRIVEMGSEEQIYELLDAHTSHYSFTALLSATPNPEIAQVFAPTMYPREDTTIYRLEIPAERCISDWHATGCRERGDEVLILGTIFPDEIVAMKRINDNTHSELRGYEHGIRVIRHTSAIDRTCRMVKDPTNWQEIATGSVTDANTLTTHQQDA